VCLGEEPNIYPYDPTDTNLYDPNTSKPLAVFDIKGSSGAETEYRCVLSDTLKNYMSYSCCGWHYDLYLLFSDCSSDLTIHDLCIYYDPLEESGMAARMDSFPATYDGVFGGVHAIMGWSKETYAVHDNKMFSEFFSRWWEDTTYYTSTAFLSMQEERSLPSGYYVPPAIAVAVGPSGNRYKYLFEKWHRAEDAAAPKDSAMIAWCIPYFDNPAEGVFWVE